MIYQFENQNFWLKLNSFGISICVVNLHPIFAKSMCVLILHFKFAKPISSTRSLKQGTNFLLTVIKAESIPTVVYLEICVTGTDIYHNS